MSSSNSLILSVVLQSLLLLFTPRQTIASSDHWSYEFGDEFGPFFWGDNFPTCDGNFNSPINLISNNALNGFKTFSSSLKQFDITVPSRPRQKSSDYSDLSDHSDYSRYIYNSDNKQPKPHDKPSKPIISKVTGLLDKWEFNNNNYEYNFLVENNGRFINLTPIDEYGNPIVIARLPNVFSDFKVNPESEMSYFCLSSLHFHWGINEFEGSEHLRNNFQYAGEIHFVHYRCDFDNISDAIDAFETENDQYVLGVVGFWLEIEFGDHNANKKDYFGNKKDSNYKQRQNNRPVKQTDKRPIYEHIFSDENVLEEIKDNIMDLEDVGDNIVLRLDLEDWVTVGKGDNNNNNFWYYEGGLTTPPCLEIVRWHVFDKTIKTNDKQLDVFRRINALFPPGQKLRRTFRPVETVTNNGDVYFFDFDFKNMNRKKLYGKEDSNGDDSDC